MYMTVVQPNPSLDTLVRNRKKSKPLESLPPVLQTGQIQHNEVL
jgi:hypothetical protein